MPPGIPVATVGISGSVNAALLAMQIMAGADKSLREKLEDYREKMKTKVAAMDESLQADL
jgi:5-(carboxyamino)imidazole ribonucleotide mutase